MAVQGETALTYHARREAEVRGYSRTVRWMKIALPIGALVLIGLIFLTGKDRGGAIDAGPVATPSETPGARARERLGHPVVDADGHSQEYLPAKIRSGDWI